MSWLDRAIEILEAINEHFQGEEQALLYSDAQILDGNISIKDAIAECLGEEEDAPPSIVVPRSKRRHIWKNQWGNWNGYLGKHRVEQFGLDEEAARSWLNEDVNHL
jgi:hypothetical protein